MGPLRSPFGMYLPVTFERERGWDPPPFVLPECGALAAQQRWQDG
jgi:hypothetical protein